MSCSTVSPDVIAALVVGLNGAIIEYLRRTRQDVKKVRVQVARDASENGSR